jgi:hypothetical protein
MESRALFLIFTMATLLTGSPLLAETPSEGVKRAYRSKPAAPIDVRWLADGSEGRVEIAVVSGVDHVGVSLRLAVSGAGAPLTASLPAATAGEVQIVSWTLDQPAKSAMRLSIDLDNGDAVIARRLVGPAVAGRSGRPKSRSRTERETSLSQDRGTADVSESVSADRLVVLPAEVAIRKADR